MSRRFLMGAVAALVFFTGATEARAATIFLDFGNIGLYGGADGLSNFGTVDHGISVSLSASGTGTLQQTSEGIGVDSRCSFPTCLDGEDPNEIDITELVVAGLSPSQYVHSVSFENLFAYFGIAGQGQYQINGGTWTTFFGDDDGAVTVNIGQAGVNSLGFRVPQGDGVSDFAVRGITVEQMQAVPEPGTMILLGSGLAGAYLRRRRKNAD